MYRKRFKQKKELGRYRSRCYFFPVPPIYPPNPLHIPPLPPLFPPGIIGGEHDQRPPIPQGILPRPRYDPIGPFPGHEPRIGLPFSRRLLRLGGSRAPDTRRGFIWIHFPDSSTPPTLAVSKSRKLTPALNSDLYTRSGDGHVSSSPCPAFQNKLHVFGQ